MSTLDDPRRFRRLAAGLCLIAAPLVYVTGLVADPALRAGTDVTGQYGEHPGWVSLSASLLHWSWVLLIPGIVGMVHLIRHRGVIFGHLAGGLALLGVVNFSGLMLGDFFYSRLEADLGVEEGTRIGDAAFDMPGAMWGFQIPGFLGLLGLLLLGLALAYAGKAPWWAPFAMVIGALAAPVFPIGTAVGGLLYLAGSGTIGLRMVRMSDDEWAGEAALTQPAGSGKVAVTR